MLALLILEVAAATSPSTFDLRDLMSTQSSCGARGSNSSDIVVCAERAVPENNTNMTFPEEEQLLPKAETGLFGRVRGKLSGQQGNVGGIVTNRAMVVVTVPF